MTTKLNAAHRYRVAVARMSQSVFCQLDGFVEASCSALVDHAVPRANFWLLAVRVESIAENTGAVIDAMLGVYFSTYC